MLLQEVGCYNREITVERLDEYSPYEYAMNSINVLHYNQVRFILRGEPGHTTWNQDTLALHYQDDQVVYTFRTHTNDGRHISQSQISVPWDCYDIFLSMIMDCYRIMVHQ